MAFKFTDKSYFAVDASVGGTLVSITAYVTEVSGLPGGKNLVEVTALGDPGAKFIPGLENVRVSLSGVYDNAATNNPETVFGIARQGTATLSIKYAPEGSGTGTAYTAEVWVAEYQVLSRVGNAVEWSASLQVDGTVLRGAA